MKYVACALVLAGCLQDHYRCEQDSDCNLGMGGRCEASRYCTEYDASCALTQRSYTEHSDDLSNTCFAGQATPTNYCVAGQAPAEPTGCGATVCMTMPACCTTTWSEACVIAAQMQCRPEATCDTRIAITATKGPKTVEIYEARLAGDQWVAKPRTDLATVAAYLSPEPGTNEPRFAGFLAFDPDAQTGPSLLAIESSTGKSLLPVDSSREYHDLVSLDFDRDLRDTLMLDWQVNGDSKSQLIQVLKLGTGGSRDIDAGVSTRMAWGALPNDAGFVDGYPDGVAGNGTTYKTLVNLETNQSAYRTLDTGITSQFNANNTNSGGGALHSFTWADLDGDGILDLVAFGNSIRIHVGGVVETPQLDLDCDPPATTCADPASTTWNGTVIPTQAGPRILAAPFIQSPGAQVRYIYEIAVHDGTFTTEQLMLPPTALCTTPCAVEAIVVRDFDGDGLPDILAIESNLAFDMALSTKRMVFTQSTPIHSANDGFGNVRVSVTGVPLY